MVELFMFLDVLIVMSINCVFNQRNGLILAIL